MLRKQANALRMRSVEESPSAVCDHSVVKGASLYHTDTEGTQVTYIKHDMGDATQQTSEGLPLQLMAL